MKIQERIAAYKISKKWDIKKNGSGSQTWPLAIQEAKAVGSHCLENITHKIIAAIDQTDPCQRWHLLESHENPFHKEMQRDTLVKVLAQQPLRQTDEDTFISTLTAYVQENDGAHDAFAYQPIVETLIHYHEDDLAAEFVEKVAAYDKEYSYPGADVMCKWIPLAQMYAELGESETAEQIYTDEVFPKLTETERKATIAQDAFKATGNNKYAVIAMHTYEKIGNYEKAMDAAAYLGAESTYDRCGQLAKEQNDAQ